MAHTKQGTGIGAAVLRVEDARLLTGRGSYTDDMNRPGQAYAALVRSDRAHARIAAIGVRAAAAMPGVLAVLTAADLRADGVRPLVAQGNPKDVELKNRDGAPIFYPAIDLLAADKVRRVGEAVALVVAETPVQAHDAAGHVAVAYEALPAVVDPRAALAPDAPRLWDETPGNLCVDDRKGDAAAVAAAFATAAHIARLEVVNNRVSGVPMEPRAAVAEYDTVTGLHTLHAGGQGVNRFQRELSAAFALPEERFRVVSRDVGGGYGTRNSLYPEFALAVWAARRLGRPVKWTGTRSEMALGDYAGRDLVTRAELALDADGKFLAMRTENIGNLGTHALSFVPIARGPTVTTGLYDIPLADVTTKGVWTNTTPVTAYRGAGRPEATFALERLIDLAAAGIGLDRIALRRRNLIAEDAFPYTNPLGVTYDGGKFRKSMAMALALSGWSDFANRRQEAARRGRLSGIGLANYVETSTGWPLERAVMEVLPGGRVDLVIGTQSSGQGHETTFRQIGSELLGVPFERIDFRFGDTLFVRDGSGSHSARSMRVGGHLFSQTRDEIVARGKAIAAHRLECAAEDVQFAAGRFVVAGTDRTIDLFDVAALANDEAADLPPGLKGPLRGVARIDKPMPAYPNGCHVAEVEIDPDTGAVALTRYSAVDDVGTVVNPVIVEGQVHGGIAQGVGQALWELVDYDPDSGQLLSGSFMDYVMPRAADFPMFDVGHNEVPTKTNLMGAKGGGEGGTTPAPAAVVNAIVDALSGYGVTHLDMPVTAEKIWRAMRGNSPPTQPSPARGEG
ncbi:MAG: molybdopterin-dependent oxidoreductase [Alphaproteobacteria bacterium]|nr:molybdopterin-dependent oxidoreductase [Alphaproteobacteria bacterium]